MDSLSTTDMSGAALVLDLKAVRIGRGFRSCLADQPHTRRASSMFIMKRALYMELPGLGSAATETPGEVC